MKKIIVLILFFVFANAIKTEAQAPRLGIASDKTIHLFGHTNNWYQIKSSTNLISGWSNFGSYFMASNTPQITAIAMTNKQEFFMASALIAVDNNSYSDTCAEHDNVNVALVGDVTNFTITATHPLYEVTDYYTEADFSNCIDEPETYYFPYQKVQISFGSGWANVYRLSSWWRPKGMMFKLNGNDSSGSYTNMHYIEIAGKIPGGDYGYPIYFVFYSDGNMRLIPFTPVGSGPDIKFGSSIIIGPASPERRPYADVESIDFNTISNTLFVVYRGGGSALIDFATVTRSNAVVKVAANYPTDQPFCTLRSMWVEDGNSDCDHVLWKDLDGNISDDPILTMSGTVGNEWFFYRKVKSKHNQSSPDFHIKLN